MEGTQLEARIVGRERELAALRAFVSGGVPCSGMLIAGGPGIGKTTLWEAGLEAAGEVGMRVLSARPSDAEGGRVSTSVPSAAVSSPR